MKVIDKKSEKEDVKRSKNAANINQRHPEKRFEKIPKIKLNKTSSKIKKKTPPIT